MRSIFLSREQVFEKPLPLLRALGAAAPATDLVLLTAPDDGFTVDGGKVNWYLADGACADRFGRENECAVCAVRPALLLEAGEEKLLRHVSENDGLITAEFGSYPAVILDPSLRDMAEKQLQGNALSDSGKRVTVCGESLPVWRLGAKQIVRVEAVSGGSTGYVQLSDGTVVSEGESVFLELRPVRWFYDPANRLLLSAAALFGGLRREEAAAYLENSFVEELTAEEKQDLPENAPFRVAEHDELSLIRAFVEAEIE